MRGKINDATAESIRQTQFTLILFSWMIKQNGPSSSSPFLSLQKNPGKQNFTLNFD